MTAEWWKRNPYGSATRCRVVATERGNDLPCNGWSGRRDELIRRGDNSRGQGLLTRGTWLTPPPRPLNRPLFLIPASCFACRDSLMNAMSIGPYLNALKLLQIRLIAQIWIHAKPYDKNISQESAWYQTVFLKHPSAMFFYVVLDYIFYCLMTWVL